ncbi:MAG: hypothetical protein GY895_06990 [Phycisphaera sp.]|nr:hypothetical protein [Phycisphaera sp.]
MRYLIPGILGLLDLAIAMRFRVRGPYVAWRMETALGKDRAAWPSIRERLHAILIYGAWARRLRRAAR